MSLREMSDAARQKVCPIMTHHNGDRVNCQGADCAAFTYVPEAHPLTRTEGGFGIPPAEILVYPGHPESWSCAAMKGY